MILASGVRVLEVAQYAAEKGKIGDAVEEMMVLVIELVLHVMALGVMALELRLVLVLAVGLVDLVLILPCHDFEHAVVHLVELFVTKFLSW